MTKTSYSPTRMEDLFKPGFKLQQTVQLGSQNFRYWNNPEDQSWDGIQLAASDVGDIVITRNIDEDYIDYWKSLIGDVTIINLKTDEADAGLYLSEYLLNNPTVIEEIKKKITNHKYLSVFTPTDLEEELAHSLSLSLHGNSKLSSTYGTKSGTRKLAISGSIPITPGFICTTVKEAEKAVKVLGEKYSSLVIKHDLSASGMLSKKFHLNELEDIKFCLDKVTEGGFIEGKDTVVIEGWVKAKVSLCVHIEIMEGKDPVICSAWQQLIDSDEVSYLGAGPLMISPKALASLRDEATKLAWQLKKKGAIGSFGPDFLIVDEDPIFSEDQAVLIELNARTPYTAYPIDIVKKVKGQIGEGFFSQHIHTNKRYTFKEISEILHNNKLLIKEKNPSAKGVVPYNIGPLPWKIMDIVAMADTFEETVRIADEVKKILAA